jgi:hypothetical protein
MVKSVNEILSKNNDLTFKNQKFYCQSCEIIIVCKTKHQTTRLSNHLKSKLHVDNKKLKKKRNNFIV